MSVDGIEIRASNVGGEAYLRIWRGRDGAFEGRAGGGFFPAGQTDGLSIEVENEWAAQLFDEVQALRVPAISIPNLLGIDGVTYSLSLTSQSCEASYSWWIEAPPDWRPLEEIHERIRRRFVESGREDALDRWLWEPRVL